MKLLCKKKSTVVEPGKYITPGKYYKFCQFYGVDERYYFLDDDIKKQVWFTTTNRDSLYYIWDYFYTPQEERKIKLEKLNETAL